jgi:hypothetical protein
MKFEGVVLVARSLLRHQLPHRITLHIAVVVIDKTTIPALIIIRIYSPHTHCTLDPSSQFLDDFTGHITTIAVSVLTITSSSSG